VSFIRASVERPIFTAMVTLIVLVVGLVGFFRLKVDLLPEIELPTVTVRTNYPGASPEVVESQVTEMVEQIVATVPGIEEITSESSEGSSRVKVKFGWGIDIDAASVELRSTVQDEREELPENIEPPQIKKFDVGSFPVVILGVSSDLDPVEMTTLVDEEIMPRFARIPGVAQVDPWGDDQREVRIALNPDRIKALELSLDEVLRAIERANLDLPAGQIEQGKNAVMLRAPSQFDSLEQIERTVIAMRGDAPVRVEHVAKVRDTYRKRQRIARINGKRGLRLAIRKQSDANTVEVSQAVLAELERVARDFPQLEVVSVVDQGGFIERSISNVAWSVLYGGGLAVFVLLVFLRDLRSTVVVALSIPMSLVATFGLMFFGGFTLNLMSLGGLALGVGMMVDNAIVVLENVVRIRDERGLDPKRAAVAGASEVATAIVASTLTTVVIFLPLAFVRGVSGVLFRDLAAVIAFSLACSLISALTIVPMLCALVLGRGAADGGGPEEAGVLARLSSRVLGRLDGAYARVLGGALARRGFTIAVALGLFLASLALVPVIGTEFMPPSDEGEVRVDGEMEIGTKLDVVDEMAVAMESMVLQEVPEAEAWVTSVGGGYGNPEEASTAEIRLTLTSASERDRPNTEVAAAVREALAGKLAGTDVRTRAPQGQFLLERVLGSDEGLTFEIRGFDLPAMVELADRVAEVVGKIDGVTDARVSQKAGTPQAEVITDRDRAAALGLDPEDVARVLEVAIAGVPVGEYRDGGLSYRILAQLDDAEHRTLDEVLDLRLQTPGGGAVPLRAVVRSRDGLGPILITRKDQQRIVTVTANVAGRDQGSVANEAIERLKAVPRPAGTRIEVAGTYEEQQRAFSELSLSFVLAVALVYMVLAAQYESLRDPLVVMLSVPVAAVGVLVTLVLTNTTLNVQSTIGCIMLGGIVVNNAILLVDQAKQLMAEGARPFEAAAKAGHRRLRPILMTTSTTILALLPLALGIGEGADAQAPLARAVLGGLASATLITLVLIPAVFTIAHREKTPPEA